jgi:hypothetical protein
MSNLIYLCYHYLVVKQVIFMNTQTETKKKMLMIHPAYVHYADAFKVDDSPFLPTGMLYAGELLEKKGFSIDYHDSQLHDLKRKDVRAYDSFGISVMGAQNIAPAFSIYRTLIGEGIDPSRIYFGGQGIEDVTEAEFNELFPNANLMRRQDLMSNNYWDVSLTSQLQKISKTDLKTYIQNELTLLFSQGCKYGCTFCGAQTRTKEKFYNTKDTLRAYFEIAKEFGMKTLNAYVTSLDFFQQALPGGNTDLLKKQLQDMIDLKKEYAITLRVRALTRADSYVEASHDSELMSLVKEAGFYQFGFGADGAANVSLLKGMHKGTDNLASKLLEAFAHAEQHQFAPEILYVFGIKEDTAKTLEETKKLCTALLEHFPSSIYRGFPAKNCIPGNQNWKGENWKSTEVYKKLFLNPELFANLGFECLANTISHPDASIRKEVNRCAVEMSYAAHLFGRVQSFLTIPVLETDGNELMDEYTFEKFRTITARYAPDIAKKMTLNNLSEYRTELNKNIPKDK